MTAFRVVLVLAGGSIDPVATNVRGLDRARSIAARSVRLHSPARPRPEIVEVFAGVGRKGPTGFEWVDSPADPVLIGTVTGGIDWSRPRHEADAASEALFDPLSPLPSS